MVAGGDEVVDGIRIALRGDVAVPEGADDEPVILAVPLRTSSSIFEYASA